jgi:hypothetical protein
MTGSATTVHRQVASVQRNQCSGDPSGSVGGKEYGESHDIGWASESTGWDTAEESFLKVWVFGDPSFQAWIEDLSGKYRVDTHTAMAPFGT